MAKITDKPKLVTIFGGSGFIGSHVARALARRGYRMRIAVRRPNQAAHLQPLGNVGQIHAVQANLRYRWSVDRAVEGADHVINLVGILAESGRQTFDAVQDFGARAVAEAELPGGTAKRNAEMIVANTMAMRAALELSARVDAEAILAMHRALMANQPRHTPGKFRTEPVWIGGGTTPIGATFVGPRHELVPGAVDDLIAFTQRDDISALPQIAVAHAQFETIHPFTDGNGRTGRALVQALLRNKGLTRQVTVPVSAGLLAGTDAYFDALTSYRSGDAAPIIERFTEASTLAIANGRQLIAELRGIRANWSDRIKARSDSAVWKVADLLTRRPVVNAALLAEELGIDSTNAHRYLTPLAEAGILVETTSRARNRVWRSPEVLVAIDAFAERAGKRV